MRRITFVIFLTALLISACAPANPQTGAATAARPTLALSDCVLPVPDGSQVSAKCGTLDVPEDRSRPEGRRIALNIAVIPAIKRKPAPDPVFLLAGGPGQSATETFPVMVQPLYNIHEGRDLVLVDQRGTGKSNPLRCLDPEKDADLTESQVDERMISCPTRLDADLRFYTTEIAMRDLDEVRAALGYNQINLYGASYGTRAALTYLRMFPDKVRTITLDAVVDPQFVMYLDAAADGQKSLDLFFARCTADDACSQAFPNLPSDFKSMLDRLDQAPQDVTIPHPVTRAPLTLTVTRRMITNLVFGSLYSPDLVATLPVSIHAASQGDYSPLISQAYLLDAGLYNGMFYAVTCTEDAPLIDPAEAEHLSANSVFGNRTIEFLRICKDWPRGQVSDGFRASFTSNVPALILSGQADPITPPWHAEKLSNILPNSTQLVFEGMGHGNLTGRCGIRVFKNFLDTANPRELDTTCVSEVQPPPFFVNFSGPRP